MISTNPALPVIEPEEEPALTPSASSGSILERRITLAELLDIKSFREVCASFVDLYKIGIKIFDADDSKLVDIRVGNGDWCGYIFANPNGRVLCTKLVTRIKQFDYPELVVGKVVEQHCFSGLKYVLMPITYGGDLLGRVVYGPFVPESLEAPGAMVGGFEGDFDLDALWTFRGKMRRAPDETISRILTNFRQVVDSIVAIAYKALMSQHLHLESITASYHELEASNRSLRASIEKLEELDRLKANFLAMISHELRTPLTSIIGYSEMLLDGLAGDLEEEQNEFVGTIKEKGEALLELIGSILDLSKIESGTIKLMRAEVDIADLLESAQSSVLPQAQKKGVGLEIELPEALAPICADNEKLGQSVVNLLANAVKFTPASGMVTVRAQTWRGAKRAEVADRFGAAEEDFVQIMVRDTGVGIPADKHEDIFKPFFQVDGSFTREHGGTGLGLAIVKSFIEAHGGEVWVESAPGEGTTFTLLVPLNPPHTAAAALPG